MKRSFLLLIRILIAAFVITACSNSNNGFTYKEGGEIWFRNSGIKLQFDQNMHLTVFYNDENIPL
jgi:hypothetical protein